MTLPANRIAELLTPYLNTEPQADLFAKLGTYLDLLLRWNGRTNLTAIREPEDLVQRQFGESLFASSLVAGGASVLDFGSGAGFPGIPLQLLRSDLRVTLAESQGKKASFLREAVRTLGISAHVWSGRVEEMPVTEVFDVVAMRAVDRTGAMLSFAADRVSPEGRLLRFLAEQDKAEMPGWQVEEERSLPLSSGRVAVFRRF